MNTMLFSGISINLLIVPFWLSWWFYLVILVLILGAGYIVYSLKMNAMLHKNADLERQLLERTELLSYAKINAQKARDDAATANQNKSALLSKISHDIRTPLNTMMGMAALLNETPLNHEQHEFTSTVLFSGENLLSIINEILMNDILEYSKVESGRELQAKEYDLRTNIEEVFDVFSLKASQLHVELIYYIDPDVPVQLIGDALRISQVLMNLVENAISVTAKGEVLVNVSLAEKIEENRAKLKFEIRDSGSGMSVQMLALVADDLQSDKENSQTAIGKNLTICKKLIRLMGGNLTVKNSAQKGSIFEFTITSNFGKQNARANTQAEMEKLTGKRILVTENNLTLSNIYEKQLKRWQFMPFMAHSGKQALELLAKESSFDLALIDMRMPEMNGIELSAEIKKLCPALPIILMNNPGNELYKNQATLFSAVVNKPLKHYIISEKMLSLLRQNGKDAVTTDQKPKNALSVEFAKEYPLNILIAEDDKMNQKLVTKVLNKLGYEPHVAENGKDVLEMVSQKNFDMILMDVQMPEMDGLEATRMIRVCLTEQPVIIAMTANTLQGDRDECLKAGMDDYIGKPVRLDGLVNIIEKWALHGKQNT